MKTARWVVIVAILGVASNLCGGERPTAAELLTAFEKSVEKLAHVRIEWDVKGRRGPNDVEVVIFRDGPRWKTDRLLLPKGDPATRGGRVREQTLVGDELLKVSIRYDDNDTPRLSPLVVAFRTRIAERTWLGLGSASIIFGRTNGDAGYPLWTVVRESGSVELLPQTEIVNGVETFVIKSRGKFGDHQLWLDPASGGLPRRIEVHKHPGELLNDEQLGTKTTPESPAQPDAKGRVPLRGLPPRNESWVRIDNIQIENQKGIFVITGFDEQGYTTYAGNKKVNSPPKTGPKIEHRLRVVVDPPEFPKDAFDFAVTIPNGTRVSLGDDRPLEFQGVVDSKHEWVDGKIRELAGN